MKSSVTLILFSIWLYQSISLCDGNLWIGSFNVQIFGQSKASKPEVMDVLAKIIRRYDIILIQEIRDSKNTAIHDLLEKVNSERRYSYSMKLSPRLGRTTIKEQYAFIYRNTTGITVKSEYVYDEESVDPFEREPYIVHFKVPTADAKEFAMVGIHVRPDDARKEIAELINVTQKVQRRTRTNNVIILGDLNADCSYVPKYAWNTIAIKTDSRFEWPIGDEVDTTISGTDCAYDRFIVTGESLRKSIVDGTAGVFRFDTEYRLSVDQAEDVSDHYPIEMQLKATSSSRTSQVIVYGIYAVGMVHFGLSQLSIGSTYYIYHEPTNRFDKNAVAIWSPRARRKVGYLRRSNAKDIAALMKLGVNSSPMVLKPLYRVTTLRSRSNGQQVCTLSFSVQTRDIYTVRRLLTSYKLRIL